MLFTTDQTERLLTCIITPLSSMGRWESSHLLPAEAGERECFHGDPRNHKASLKLEVTVRRHSRRPRDCWMDRVKAELIETGL